MLLDGLQLLAQLSKHFLKVPGQQVLSSVLFYFEAIQIAEQIDADVVEYVLVADQLADIFGQIRENVVEVDEFLLHEH